MITSLIIELVGLKDPIMAYSVMSGDSIACFMGYISPP